MAPDTRDLLLAQTCSAMRSLARPEAIALAFEITQVINRRLAGIHTDDDALAKRVETLIPKHLQTRATLDVGWAAVDRVFGHAGEGNIVQTEFVCSLPPLISEIPAVREAIRSSGLWPGSLLARVGALFQDANSELIIISPYWSTAGVQVLLRHLLRDSFNGVSIKIFTQPMDSLNLDAIAAVRLLESFLKLRNANVSVAALSAMNGRAPLMHAKTVIQDGVKAYVGSANFSAGGIENNVEVGVIVHGSCVCMLHNLINAIKDSLHEWEV